MLFLFDDGESLLLLLLLRVGIATITSGEIYAGSFEYAWKCSMWTAHAKRLGSGYVLHIWHKTVHELWRAWVVHTWPCCTVRVNIVCAVRHQIGFQMVTPFVVCLEV